MVTPWRSFLGLSINTELKIGVRNWNAGQYELAQGIIVLCGMDSHVTLWQTFVICGILLEEFLKNTNDLGYSKRMNENVANVEGELFIQWSLLQLFPLTYWLPVYQMSWLIHLHSFVLVYMQFYSRLNFSSYFSKTVLREASEWRCQMLQKGCCVPIMGRRVSRRHT